MLRLVLTLWLAAPLAHAQTAPFETWVGVSGGVQASPLTLGASAHVTAGRGSTAIRAAFDYGEEFVVWSGAPTTLNAASLCVAVQLREGRGRLMAHGGPALVWGRGRYQSPSGRQRYQNVGLAVGGSAVLGLSRSVGIGLDVSGTLNPEVSTVGVRFATHVRIR